MSARVIHGDCIEEMRAMPDASVDAIVTDPPYGLGFMGKAWDDLPPGEEWARECLRVLKPGGHLLAFGGTRTWHRLAVAVEDAGFEIRDSIAWLYGSGFPKSLDVAKAIDQRRDDRADILRVTGWLAEQRDRAGWTNQQIDDALGVNGMALHWTSLPHRKVARVPRWEQWEKLRELLGFGDEMDAEVWRLNGRKGTPGEAWNTREVLETRRRAATGRAEQGSGGYAFGEDFTVTAPATSEAEQWQGWGTALKPAFEPIVVGRKPLAGTVAANVLAHGTGALNIDGNRTGTESFTAHGGGVTGDHRVYNGDRKSGQGIPALERGANPRVGRWPTNVVLDDTQAAELDRQSGVLTSPATYTRSARAQGEWLHAKEAGTERVGYGDSGGASRFFPTFKYQAKAPKRERPKVDGVAHPTVKPLELMRWLVRLVTPPGGVVLDPFAGSGTTIEAALLEGFDVVGVEREAEYLPLIDQRVARASA